MNTQKWFNGVLRGIDDEKRMIRLNTSATNDPNEVGILALRNHGVTACQQLLENTPPKNNESIGSYKKRVSGLLKGLKKEGRKARLKKPDLIIKGVPYSYLANCWVHGVEQAWRAVLRTPLSGPWPTQVSHHQRSAPRRKCVYKIRIHPVD